MNFLSSEKLIAQADTPATEAQGIGSYQLLEPGVLPDGNPTTPSFGSYFGSMIQTVLILGAALAVLMIVIGGIEKIISNTPAGKSKGTSRMTNALIGLFLIIVSASLLAVINPNLLSLNFFTPGPLPSTLSEEYTPPVTDPGTAPVIGEPPVVVPSGSSEFATYFNFMGANINQVDDASPQLSSMLLCMGQKLELQGIKATINSISDRDHVGNLEPCRISRNKSGCAHKSNSACHYGGATVNANKSFAVDIHATSRTPEVNSKIKQAAQSCGSYYIHDEVASRNHWHIESQGCR